MKQYLNAQDLQYLLGLEVFHPKECVIGTIWSITEANFSDSIEIKFKVKNENLLWSMSFTHHYLQQLGTEGLVKEITKGNKLLNRPIYKLIFNLP